MPKLISRRRYPLGNAYCLVPIGNSELVYREYAVTFQSGVKVYIDPEKSNNNHHLADCQRTGRQLLQRFYDLKLAPLVFKWYKAKNRLETNHWLCLYPAHYLVKVEQSEKGVHSRDHLATLFYRGETDIIPIAQQEYEGHLKGNDEYDQPSILQEELREWRLKKQWFQDAFTRETIYEI